MLNINDLQNGNFTEEELTIAKGIFTRSGNFRASKPKTAKKTVKKQDDSFSGWSYYYANEKEILQGEVAYVWRMVAFFISPNRQHKCMPVTAEFDLNGSVKKARQRAKELDILVNKIVGLVPIEKQSGTITWGRALGMI